MNVVPVVAETRMRTSFVDDMKFEGFVVDHDMVASVVPIESEPA